MKKRYILLFFIVVIGFCSWLFSSFYNQIKQGAIVDLNNEQLLHARHAARGIEDFFNYWMSILTSLSESTLIIDMDETAKWNIELLYNANQDKIRAITRVDAEGRIVYTYPFNPDVIGRNISQQDHVREIIGRNISQQDHVREIMRTHKPVISDVFFAVQGYDTVAIHVPVFRNRIYQGTIAVTINFQALSKRYIEDIKIGKTGYAWMTSRDGIKLYCPVPGHTGESILEMSKDSPSKLAMVKDMLKGHQGSAIYIEDKILGDKVDLGKKHAVFMPIKLGNTFWSVVVCSSEDEIIASLENYRNKLILVIGLLLLGGVLFSFYGLKASFIIKEEKKRRLVEKALLDSEERYRTLVENASELIFELDDTGHLTFVNPAALRVMGYEEKDLIGKHYATMIRPDMYEEALKFFGRQFVKGIENTYSEYPVIVKDGREIWLGQNTRLIFKDGKVVAFQAVARDITERKHQEKQLQDTLESLRKAVGTTIQVLTSTVETRDPYTAGHQTRSADLARAIGTEMELPQEKIDAIRIAGSIHDIGKLSIPAEILSKPNKLSDIEFSLIKEHARKGYEMLKDVESPWPLAEIVYQHHERMDGSGYPRNLKGEEICIEARILAVSDVVEAMASHRPYRPGLGIDAALNEIEKNRGIFYDNAVADTCLRLFREKGFQLAGT